MSFDQFKIGLIFCWITYNGKYTHTQTHTQSSVGSLQMLQLPLTVQKHAGNEMGNRKLVIGVIASVNACLLFHVALH